MIEPQEHNCVRPSPRLKPSCSLTLSKNPTPSASPHPATQVWLLATEAHPSGAAHRLRRRPEGRRRPDPRARPYQPSPDAAPGGGGPRGARRSPCRAALESETCLSHFILRQPLGRARHALPHSHGRPREPGPGAGGARRAPRKLAAANTERAAQTLLPVAAPASAEQPPRATSGVPSDPRSRPGRPAGSPPRGQSWSAPGGGCRRGGGSASGRRGAALSPAPRVSLFPAARRRGRREGPRPRAPGLGGGSRPPRRACAAPRPAPELCASPPPAQGPPPSARARVLRLPGLRSPRRRAPRSCAVRSPRPRPARRGARRKAPAARRALPSGRGATADLGCEGRRGRRGCLKRRASPRLTPAASPSSSEGYLHPHRAGLPAGTQVPDTAGMQECERALSGLGETSLCVPRLNTPFPPRRRPGYLRRRQRPRACRVGRRGAQHPPRPADSLCSARAAAGSSLPGGSPGHPRVGVGLGDQPPSTCQGPPTKSG